MQNKRTSKLISLTFGVLVLCFLIGFYIYAWTGPSASPPSGNVEPPVRLGIAGPDSDTTANPSIYINDTGGGNLLQLQSQGSDRFIIDNSGNVTAKADIDVQGTLYHSGTDSLILNDAVNVAGNNNLTIEGTGKLCLGGECKGSWPEGMSTSSDYGRSGVSDTLYEGTDTLSSKYLGISDKAADADKLDNHDSTYFMTTTTDNWVDTSGDTMSGELNMGDNKITGLAAPVADSDAATKAYVDAAGGGGACSDNPPVGCYIGVDMDGDGYTVLTGDCDESCPTCYAGSTVETDSPDGHDQDCDGVVDNSYTVWSGVSCDGFPGPPKPMSTAQAACDARCKAVYPNSYTGNYEIGEDAGAHCWETHTCEGYTWWTTTGGLSNTCYKSCKCERIRYQ